jgi:hypothetical protein
LAASLFPLLLLVQLALMWHDPRIASDMVTQDLPANRQLNELLARTNGPIISEDMGPLVLGGRVVVYYSFLYSSLARSGQWDQAWELNGLRDGEFPLVILDHGTREDVDHYARFTREFVSALDHYYERAETIGKYEVYRPDPLQHARSADFGGDIGMIGWSIVSPPDQPGALQVQIVWQAEQAMTRRFTAFVHLENADGSKIAQDDHEPHVGDYPTTHWAPNEMVRETYTLNATGGLTPGPKSIRVGWYDTVTHDRLPVPGSQDDTVLLTTVDSTQ